MRAVGISKIIAVIGAALSMTACSQEPRNDHVTVASLRSEINDALAVGASPSDVKTFLAKKGIEHSSLIDNAKHVSTGSDPNTYEIGSIVRNTSRSLFVTTDVRAVFTFSRDKKLLRTKVEEVHTGL